MNLISPLAKVTRPAMRYHGGKWKLAPWIISNFPEHRIYVEPYGGAASVLLRKSRCYAEVYNDLDAEVVNVFNVFRDHGDKLKKALWATPFARDEFIASYYPSSDPIEQARRTIARSFMGFGSSSVTKTRHTTSRFSKPTTGFRANSNRSGTVPAHTRDAGSDYKYEMKDECHAKLADILKSVKGKVCLSGYPNDLYEKLYKGWFRIEKKALADGAAERTEVLWMNYQPSNPRLI